MNATIKYGILYVDDDESNLRVFRQAFKRNFLIFIASSGADGLEILYKNADKIQLIITDQIMPRMSGVEFLQNTLPKYENKIRMILTGHSDIEHITIALNECGIFRYMSKPWRVNEMNLNIERAIEVYKLRTEHTQLIEKLQQANESLESEVKARTAKLYQEIEERKKAETVALKAQQKAEEASQAKEIFLSTMSHEIRTPLNGIIGISNLLMDSKLDEDQTENVESLQFVGKHLLALVNDVLDFSKINARKIELEKQNFNLLTTLQEIHRMFEARAKCKNIELHLKCMDNIPKFVLGDQIRFSQIMTNLLGNALKFTEKGNIITEVNLGFCTDKRIEVLFQVSDTGIGIPKNKIESIFDNFSQATSSTTRKYGGTGLGLAITRKLIELYGGTIEVESKLSKGSAFRFNLFFEIGSEIEKASIKKAQSYKNLNGISILVADDNKINTMLLKKFLVKWNAKPDFASHGEMAYQMVQQKKYEIILMDIHMPVMNGYDASKKIRVLKEEIHKNIPIIALTASTLAGEEEKIKQCGINDFVIKPFEPDYLYDKILEYTT